MDLLLGMSLRNSELQKYASQAVRNDGLALEYVHNQTEVICLAAVKQDGRTLIKVNDELKTDGFVWRLLSKMEKL